MTGTIPDPIQSDRPKTFANSIDYWRRKRGFTWVALAHAIGLRSHAALIRAAQIADESQTENGGGIG